MQHALPAVFMRGGTSKALVFHARDLPAEPARRDALLLAAMGSPDPYGRQLDGMGGGVSSVSKVCIVAPSERKDADVDFTFCQVGITQPEIDLSGTCGNMVAAVGHFAVEEGLVAGREGETTVRVWNTNLSQRIDLTFPVRDGRPVVTGDLALPGVAGTAAGVRVAFVDPGGKGGQGVLPTGVPRDMFTLPDGRAVEGSVVDSAAACLFVRAGDLGCTGAEPVTELDGASDLLASLEALRCDALIRLGRAADVAQARRMAGALRIAMIAPPGDYTDLAGNAVRAADHDLLLRMLAAGVPHRAVPISSALCLATAAQIDGTLVAATAGAVGGALRLGTPSGVVAAEATVSHEGEEVRVADASIWRTARRLMQGEVLVPAAAVAG